jgi:HSP20 family protein
MALALRHRETNPQPVQRWAPFREMEDLHDRIEQLMEGALSGAGIGDARVWVPFVDVEETEDAWIVEAEVPGAEREDVNIEMLDGELTIRGEIKERERVGILRRRTRRVGNFEFRVTLPGPADADKIEAQLDSGVLTVRVPKAEQAKPRRIEVTNGDAG